MRSASDRSSLLCAIVLGAVAALPGACRRHAKVVPGEVHVRLVSGNGRPLAGARVTIARESAGGPAASAEARADPNGKVTVGGLVPGRYLLRTEARGYATVSLPFELAAGDSLNTVLNLEPEQLLEGLVQDGQGKPLPDALVLAWPSGGRRAPLVEAHSGPDGRFTLAGLPRGAWTLLAEAPGFGTLQLDRVDVPARQLVLKLEGQSRSLGGLVLGPDGQGRSGARVVLGGPALRAPRETGTDGKGTFVFHGIGFGRFTVRATLERMSSLPSSYTVDEGTGWVPPFKLTLEPGAFLAGRVSDDRDRPLAGTTIELVAIPSDDLPETATADAQGRFEVGPLPAGRYQVQARRPDHVLMDAPEVRLRTDAQTRVLLKMPRAARLSGRVVDSGGHPLAGVSITAVGLIGGSDQLTVLTGALPLAAEAAVLPAQALVRRGRIRTATSDAQGRFRIDEMPPGRSRLDLVHAEALPLRREPILLGAGDAQDLGDLVLQPGALLAGRVLDEGGRPLEGARVEARASKGRAPPVRVSADRDGRFAVRVPGGDYALVAVAPERAPQSIFSFHADPATPPPPLEFRLPRADGAVEGQVREAGGHGVGRVQVVALAPPLRFAGAVGDPYCPRAAAEAARGEGALALAAASTDASGRFKLTGLPQGMVVLEARHPDWPAVAQVAKIGERSTLELRRPGGIEGEVRDKASGAFVARYELEAEGPDGRRADRVQTLGAGFQVTGLLPGKWTLRVRSPGYAQAEQAVEVPSAAAPHKDPYSVRDVRVPLSHAAAGGAPHD
jgi:hypothetical protein